MADTDVNQHVENGQPDTAPPQPIENSDAAQPQQQTPELSQGLESAAAAETSNSSLEEAPAAPSNPQDSDGSHALEFGEPSQIPEQTEYEEPVAASGPEPERFRHWIAEWALTAIVLLFAITGIVQSYVIPTVSMEATLLQGDHLLVDKLAYAPAGPLSRFLLPYEQVKRGDILVFRWPIDIRQNYVKRCIGIPGDRIKVVNKQVYVNGKALNEPYAVHRTPYIDSYRDNFPSYPNAHLLEPALAMLENNVVNGEVVVPPGHYFAMGDNRDNSSDSRYWGFVPRENIVGKPLMIFWSYDAPTEDLADPNFMSKRHFMDLTRNFFRKTRWNRCFQFIHGYPLN